MAKNLLHLFLKASLVCCLAAGFSTSGTTLNSGFEAVLYGELSLPTRLQAVDDTDAPDIWLHSPERLALPIAWGVFVIAALAMFAPAPLRYLKPIRAPPAQR